MTTFGQLVGQDAAVAQLTAAVQGAAEILDGGTGPAMTHAWLFVGPPGSGRSVAAGAFAAALQCPAGGCGTCPECRDVSAGTHPDVTEVEPPGVHYLVDQIRDLAARAALAPVRGRWRVMVLEDADRLEAGSRDWRPANALLKVIEEPPPRTVWILCAPSTQDIVPTIRSRCRTVALRTPTAAEVARVLVDRYGADPAIAATAARVSQGHIGHARRFVREEDERIRRARVLQIPATLSDLDACLQAAAEIVEAADERTDAEVSEREAAERQGVRDVYGMGTRGIRVAGADKAMKELEKEQKRRQRRVKSDAVDVALLDLLGFYRDVLLVQIGADVAVINAEQRHDVETAATASSPATTLRRMEEILRTRAMLAGTTVTPRLALESLFVTLRDPAVVD